MEGRYAFSLPQNHQGSWSGFFPRRAVSTPLGTVLHSQEHGLCSMAGRGQHGHRPVAGARTGQEGLGLLLSFVTPRLWSWRERVVRTPTSCPSCVGRRGSGARAGQSSSVTTLSPRWSTAQRSQPWSREDTPEHRLLAGASWASCPRPGRQTRITGGGHWGTCATPFVLCQLRRASSPCRRWLGPGCTASAGQAAHTELGPTGSVGPQHE